MENISKIKEKYNAWNIKKQHIQDLDTTKDIYFKEGQVWWCSLGQNIGDESYGKGENFRRPILIIKKLSHDLCICLPLTSKEKIGTWFIDITLQETKRWVMLSQIRTVHKKRFSLKIGELTYIDMIQVKEKLEALLELSVNRHSTK